LRGAHASIKFDVAPLSAFCAIADRNPYSQLPPPR
jgi:hypothetical protein